MSFMHLADRSANIVRAVKTAPCMKWILPPCGRVHVSTKNRVNGTDIGTTRHSLDMIASAVHCLEFRHSIS